MIHAASGSQERIVHAEKSKTQIKQKINKKYLAIPLLMLRNVRLSILHRISIPAFLPDSVSEEDTLQSLASVTNAALDDAILNEWFGGL